MSRSIHKTVKCLFGGKSAREIDEMIAEDDPDVVELRRKRRYKDQEQVGRALSRRGHGEPQTELDEATDAT